MRESSHEELLAKALETVGGDRRDVYGSPKENHQRIAWLWTVYLMEKGKTGEFEIGPVDVAIMMMLVKIARLIATPGHFDSLVDVAGYAAIAWEMVGAPSEYREGNRSLNTEK